MILRRELYFVEKRSSTIQDVADLANVSIATVSRVVNDAGYPVRTDTRRRVLEAIDALGFRPSPIARSLVGKPTQTIGLIIPDISNPYYPLLSRGVEDAANELGYTVIFCNTDRSSDKMRRYLQVLREKQVDGFIFAGGGLESQDEDFLPEEIGGKVVMVGRHRLPFPSVQVDNCSAAYEATCHLIGLGHRRIAFVNGPAGSTSASDRQKGYQQAMAKSGIAQSQMMIYQGDFRYESGYQAAIALLHLTTAPTAIFAANDRMAIGVMAGAFDQGRRTPQDLAVLGFDDIPPASFVRPSLTTVSLPSYEMGVSAVQLLSSVLAGEPVERTIWLHTSLVVRQSTENGPAASGQATEIGH